MTEAPQVITFNCTEKLKGIIKGVEQANSQEQFRYFLEEVRDVIHVVENFIRIYKRDEYARQAQFLVDKAISADMRERGREVTCFGCRAAHCCSIHVAVSDLEVETMFDRLFPIGLTHSLFKATYGREAYERLKRQAAALNALDKEVNYSTEYGLVLSKDDRRCVFLGDNNLCMVYSQRPLLCRLHFVADKPANCEWDGVTEKPLRIWASYRGEASFIAFTNVRGNNEGVPLSVAVWKFLQGCKERYI
jgi:Fe-S-cluster containining protein